MNLTSKRMLQGLTAIAGVFALTATAAASWVSDSFEGTEGTNGMPIVEYKALFGTLGEITNGVWAAEATDASKITDAESSAGYSATSRPIPGADQNLVLQLETDGNILTRHVIGDGAVTGKSFSGSAVYVDTLIKFTPSEDPPTISNDVKVAVYVNVDSNLVVYHGKGAGIITNSVFESIVIDPASWYRLTIQMIDFAGSFQACSIYLNGNKKTHANADGENQDLFLTAASGHTLSAVAFQGTGYVDELVVSDTADFGGTAAVLLTLAYDVGSVLTNGAEVGNGGTVETGTLLTINAPDWYNVTNVLGDGVTYAGELGLHSVTGIVSAASATTAYITFGQYASGTTSMGSETVDAAKLSAWAIANSKSEAEVDANASSWYDDYLMNVAPDTNPTIEITSITVDNANSEATIVVTASSTSVDFDTINGTLNVYTTSDLGTAFGLVATENLSFSSDNDYTISVTVPFAQGSFIKAKVE